jgi:hypothetical protein
MPKNIDQAVNYFKYFDNFYSKEINWLKTTKFVAPDIASLPGHPIINWTSASNSYRKIKNFYSIEAVLETDEYQQHWLTEKTAKVLAFGKPFVLLSGKNTLSYLHDLGYKTFGDVLDESYDSASNPSHRIQGIVKSLRELYTCADKNKRILKMYNIANHNRQRYTEHAKSIIQGQ